MAIATRPSATARPSASQAIALVAEVEESMPMTRSRDMPVLQKNERRGMSASAPVQGVLEKPGVPGLGVDDLCHRIHALLRVATVILAGHQLADLGRQFVGRVADPKREMRFG